MLIRSKRDIDVLFVLYGMLHWWSSWWHDDPPKDPISGRQWPPKWANWKAGSPPLTSTSTPTYHLLFPNLTTLHSSRWELKGKVSLYLSEVGISIFSGGTLLPGWFFLLICMKYLFVVSRQIHPWICIYCCFCLVAGTRKEKSKLITGAMVIASGHGIS